MSKKEYTFKKLKGEIFAAKDSDGYIKLFFQLEDGKTVRLESICGGGYYSDVFMKELKSE